MSRFSQSGVANSDGILFESSVVFVKNLAKCSNAVFSKASLRLVNWSILNSDAKL
jgi:hypothetical protein